jgi:glycosyltransferase involved in cell wall biosynthesis
VYTIALNEARHVDRWASSCADADYRIIVDTGSTDNTVEIAKRRGVTVYRQSFDPWRFDTARNYALSMVPDDATICIALDMDEILCPGWRQALESVYADNVDRYRYKYVWSWDEEGMEGLVYGGDKIHARYGLSWRHPVHEVLKKNKEEPEVQRWVDGLEIHHHPDSSKPRSQYLPLLELAVEEDPNDDRNRFYLGREYMFAGENEKAAEQFIRHLELSRWAPERAAACRLLYKVTGDSKHLYNALAEDPSRRENYVALANHFYETEQWRQCLAMVKAALTFVDKPMDYLCEGEAWSYLPYDIGAIACYRLGMYDHALGYGQQALNLRPGDNRLVANLNFYEQAVRPTV